MNSTFLLGKLTPFTNKSSLLVNNQNTTDIIKQIIETHNLYKKDYDKIAGYFWKGNTKQTCKYLFDFLKNNVKYSIEPDSRQSVKSPSAILATGKFANGYNDCKHYSLFQAGVFDALNRMGKKINWCYRFANYKIFSTTPHHVFVVVKINGVEYWCDPVLDTWNNKKPYINKIDKKMSLYSISGVGCMSCQYGQSEIGRVPRKARRAARRSGVNCTGRAFAKYNPAFVLSRKAFLFIVRLNFRHLAVRMNAAMQHPESAAKIMQKWCSVGGNAKLLKSTIAKATAKYKIKHPHGKYVINGGIGVAPLVIPAAWQTATPIIAAMVPIISAAAKFLPAGSKAREITENVTDLSQAVTDATVDTEQTPGSAAGVGAMNPYLIYGALGLGAVYLLMSKKRR